MAAGATPGDDVGSPHDRQAPLEPEHARTISMSLLASELPVSGTSVILPDAGGVLTALSRIGYDLEVALADLVDNSIDAGARNILIRFLRSTDRITGLAVVDDGGGINRADIDDAMGFGAYTGKDDRDLGKYGMGLKSASFSQAQSVGVLSLHHGSVVGRRWTADNVRAGWICEHIDEAAAAQHLTRDWGPVRLDGSGTLIHWDDLDAFRVARHRADGVLEEYFSRISVHLGLHFHRFLSTGRAKIFLDAVNEELGDAGSPRPVYALDPFAYPQSGQAGYPRTFRTDIPDVGSLDLEAHIWPRRSRQPSYLLGGGKVAERQGFYFYRNDRLIQAGGWNGIRTDAEPHASLARVKVELPGAYDHAFGLNVQKSGVSVPAQFIEAVTVARSGELTFANYIRDAIEAYGRKPRQAREVPLVPSNGVPKRLARQARVAFAGSARANVRPASIAWRVLPEDRFFFLDHDEETIVLNSLYRVAVVSGRRQSPRDAPLVKMLMFLLLGDKLDRQRMGGSSRDWLARCQSVLVAAAKAQLP